MDISIRGLQLSDGCHIIRVFMGVQLGPGAEPDPKIQNMGHQYRSMWREKEEKGNGEDNSTENS